METTYKNNWPDSIRLEMIEHSKFYDDPRIYQYGFYDGYQKMKANHDKLLEALEAVNDYFNVCDKNCIPIELHKKIKLSLKKNK
jgi:hypothetical protein